MSFNKCIFLRKQIFSLDQAASHIKLVLERNEPFKTSYQTICVWQRDVLTGFAAGEQVVITFFYWCDILQIKVEVERNSRGFFKLVKIVIEAFDNCGKCYSNVAITDRQV